ncbi:hypothetical protein DITRI_Ditri10aG0037800 [Diplodiscus trichospermus]
MEEQKISFATFLLQGEAEYERELNRFMKFAPNAFKNDKETEIQRFLCGLGPRLQHEVRSFELTTYSIVVNKAKLLEQGHKMIKEDSESNKKKRNWAGSSNFQGQSFRSNSKKANIVQSGNRSQ